MNSFSLLEKKVASNIVRSQEYSLEDMLTGSELKTAESRAIGIMIKPIVVGIAVNSLYVSAPSVLDAVYSPYTRMNSR